MIMYFVDDYVTLKQNLSDEIEYSLLPKPAWDKLVSWYGLQQGQVCIVKSMRIYILHEFLLKGSLIH